MRESVEMGQRIVYELVFMPPVWCEEPKKSEKAKAPIISGVIL